MDIIQAQTTIKEGSKILKEYFFLIDTSILDFFTNNIWNELPTSWQIFFDNANLQELATFLNLNSEISQNDTPMCLLNLRNSIINNSLPRKTVNINENNPYPKDYKTNCNNVTLNKLLVDLPLYKEFCCMNGLFIKEFFRRVKMKKRHEIQVLSNMVYKSAVETKVDFVVDVGAGLGHLSRTLCYIYGINVVAIEQDTVLNKTANELDEKIKKTIQFLYPDYKEVLQSLVHYTYQIKPTTDVNDFINILRDAQTSNKENFTFGIVGLHPCGNLAATLLKFYKKCKQCRFINLASCCYMKLTTLEDTNHSNDTTIGFPLSKTAEEINLKICNTARDLACHAIELYIEKLQSNNLEVFQVHCYRAVLEVLITNRYPDHRHMQTQNVKYKNNLTFSEFCRLSIKGKDITLNDEDIDNEATKKMLSQWKRVVAFYCLRLIFAPLIETIILLDRYIFLHESNEVELVVVKPCFDPRTSPRTHVISSLKKMME